ncbi:hypothetical protein Spico_0360 [Parasphaerochaeta coccoides DSM 17374]|uniref:Thioredoxin domain-containing protein n=2 Tax=Parasphaerochaeta TaxID=3062336 RepID=F4GHQ1_PARC1|nr:hypothetical protein Spico_0360 [Parasphaerochaeta coccoides DSM 17374]
MAVSVVLVLILASCASTVIQNNVPIDMTFEDMLQGKCFYADGRPALLSSDYYLIYYAADWCPYCKEYEPLLKKTYENLIRMYGNVEIIFVGHERDVSNDNLVSFMEQGGYSFPYLKFEYREETGIMHLVDVPKFYIPGFVLVDKQGKVLASSNGETADDYSRDYPIQYYTTLQICDCFGEE